MKTKNSVEHPSSNSPKPLLLDQYPKKNFWDFSDIFQSQGFWYTNPHLEAARDILAHFEARDNDIFLASSIKTGTTCLKALCFSIIHGWKNVDVKVDEEEEEEDDPLVKNTPSSCVQTIENQVYMTNPTSDLLGMPSPRLFHTHFPYSALPDSIKNSDGISLTLLGHPSKVHTLLTKHLRASAMGFTHSDPSSIRKDYWEASLKKSDKILFLRYEEIKRDPKGLVKRLASFLGRPFVNEEEVEKALWRCSLDRLKNLEVNKNGSTAVGLPRNSFYRLGVVGHWKNNFSHEMEERLDQISSMKLQKTGHDLNK
ncbi:unnamed protein product [Camellia sinensis]